MVRKRKPAVDASVGLTEQQVRARILLLGISVLLLVLLLGAWLVVRARLPAASSADHTPFFSQPAVVSLRIPGDSAEDLLELARKTAESIVTQFPDSAAAYCVQANYHYMLSDTAEAEANWRRAAELDPTLDEGLYGVALVAFEDGRFDDAIELCLQLRTLSPGNPKVPLLLADAYLNNGQPEQAILVLQQHIAQERASVQALELLGRAHLNADEPEKAAAVFRKALEFAPQSKEILYGLGQAYGRMGQADKSREYMERFRTRSQQVAAENAAAAQEFEDRAHAAHIAAQVLFDTAMVYKAQGDLDAAIRHAVQAHFLEPHVDAWLLELQRLLQRQGRLLDAADVGREWVQRHPDDVDQWLVLGGLYAELDMADQAVEAFQKAIALAPEDPRCKRAKSVLRSLQP
ncbi:MAG: tetratricopeptide repeat protein [Planctomycetota bacterium]|nr:MAG: tetratricopeptide repeat protein [Planctomycetota bacterium]